MFVKQVTSDRRIVKETMLCIDSVGDFTVGSMGGTDRDIRLFEMLCDLRSRKSRVTRTRINRYVFRRRKMC